MPRHVGSSAIDREQRRLLKERNSDAEKDILGSDYFRMFVFKIEVCTKKEPHDWTLCHFAHETEKARRRNPSDFINNHNSCTEFRKHGSCRAGDRCTFAHGVFEGWLTPARYRTKMCTNWREGCNRPICFFAHSAQQLRSPTLQNTTDMQVLRDELMWDFMHHPVHAANLGQICNSMQLQEPSEIVGRNLATMQWLLNNMGQPALPQLLALSSKDLVSLKLTMQIAGNLHDPSASEAIGSVYGAHASRDDDFSLTQPNRPPPSSYPNLQSMQVGYKNPQRPFSGRLNLAAASQAWPAEGQGLDSATQQSPLQDQGGQGPDVEGPTNRAHEAPFHVPQSSTHHQYQSRECSLQDLSMQDLTSELRTRLSLGQRQLQDLNLQERQNWGQMLADANAMSGQIGDQQDYASQHNSHHVTETLSAILSLLSQRDSQSNWNELQDFRPFRLPQADRELSEIMRPPNN